MEPDLDVSDALLPTKRTPQETPTKPNQESQMQKMTIIALLLSSGSAFATDARTSALSDNVGITDDTDFMTYASRTDDVGDNAWLNYGGALSGAASWDGHALTVSGAEGAAAFGWYNGKGDSGYSAGIGLDEATNTLSLGGSYSMSDGDDDMAFGGSIDKGEEDIGIALGVSSRSFEDGGVTAWGAGLGYSGDIDIAGNYAMGTNLGDGGALTIGPAVGVTMPEEGDMALDLDLANVNLAGEFMFNDWFGLRGSVTAGVGLEGLTGGGDMYLSATGASGFGAAFAADGANIDITVDPSAVLAGPYFLTGNVSGHAVTMSARFDI